MGFLNVPSPLSGDQTGALAGGTPAPRLGSTRITVSAHKISATLPGRLNRIIRWFLSGLAPFSIQITPSIVTRARLIFKSGKAAKPLELLGALPIRNPRG